MYVHVCVCVCVVVGGRGVQHFPDNRNFSDNTCVFCMYVCSACMCVCVCVRSARRRDAPDASDRLTSFSVEGRGSGRFREGVSVSIVAAGGPRSR